MVNPLDTLLLEILTRFSIPFVSHSYCFFFYSACFLVDVFWLFIILCCLSYSSYIAFNLIQILKDVLNFFLSLSVIPLPEFSRIYVFDVIRTFSFRVPTK